MNAIFVISIAIHANSREECATGGLQLQKGGVIKLKSH